MIDIAKLSPEGLKDLLDWLEHPVSTEIFFPGLVDVRNQLLELMISDEKNERVSEYRAKIKQINGLFALHDRVIDAINEQK